MKRKHAVIDVITHGADKFNPNSIGGRAALMLTDHTKSLAQLGDHGGNLALYIRYGVSCLDNFPKSVDSVIRRVRTEREGIFACGSAAGEIIAELKKWKKASKKVDEREFQLLLSTHWLLHYLSPDYFNSPSKKQNKVGTL